MCLTLIWVSLENWWPFMSPFCKFFHFSSADFPCSILPFKEESSFYSTSGTCTFFVWFMYFLNKTSWCVFKSSVRELDGLTIYFLFPQNCLIWKARSSLAPYCPRQLLQAQVKDLHLNYPKANLSLFAFYHIKSIYARTWHVVW